MPSSARPGRGDVGKSSARGGARARKDGGAAPPPVAHAEVHSPDVPAPHIGPTHTATKHCAAVFRAKALALTGISVARVGESPAAPAGQQAKRVSETEWIIRNKRVAIAHIGLVAPNPNQIARNEAPDPRIEMAGAEIVEARFGVVTAALEEQRVGNGALGARGAVVGTGDIRDAIIAARLRQILVAFHNSTAVADRQDVVLIVVMVEVAVGPPFHVDDLINVRAIDEGPAAAFLPLVSRRPMEKKGGGLGGLIVELLLEARAQGFIFVHVMRPPAAD